MKLLKDSLVLTLGLIIGFLIFPVGLNAQVISSNGNSLCWDQVASSLQESQSFVYQQVVDQTPKTIISNVVCSGQISPFTCQIPLPINTSGSHTVSITASTRLTDGTLLESPSGSFTYVIGIAPSAPSNFRIIKTIGTFLLAMVGIR